MKKNKTNINASEVILISIIFSLMIGVIGYLSYLQFN